MNNTLKKFNLNPRTIILATLFSLAFFLVGFSKFRTYQSEITILAIPKSATAIKQKDQIINNIVQLSKSLAFYDRLLKDNPNFQDSAMGERLETRKQVWNEMLSISRVDEKSSTIVFSISSSNEGSADLVASKTARTIFDVTSAYYNVKDDVDLRIIDGPITKTNVTGWPWLVLISIILGSLVGVLVEKIITLERKTVGLPDIFKNNPLRNLNQKKVTTEPMPLAALENLYETEKVSEVLSEKKLAPVAPAEILPTENLVVKEQIKPQAQAPTKEIEHLQEIVSRNVYPNFPELPVHNIGEKATAPSNLPIGDFDFSFGPMVESEPALKEEVVEEVEEVVPAVAKIHEPTPEQLKERLNQLLKGEI